GGGTRRYGCEGRARHGWSCRQRGRCLCRGALGEVPDVWFALHDIAEGVDMFAPRTLGALMAERFEVYKREQVVRFYQDHFRQYSRQIVLVDVLRALLAGRGALDDTRPAPDALLASLPFRHPRGPSQALLRPP